jgi:F-type H+-transporting ATPase subunit a
MTTMAASAGGGKHAGPYIQHHLHNWAVGAGALTLNLDTIVFSLIAGGLLVFAAWRAGQRITSGAPGRLQGFLEVIVEFVNQQIHETFPGRDRFIGPLALTVFIWVAMMNSFDIIPVDLFPRFAEWVAGWFGFKTAHLRIVPTAELNNTIALAISVFVLTIIYGIRANGVGGYLKHFLTHPFGIYMAPFNVFLTVIEEFAKPLSLALRLWGNMFAGELIFMLIALFGYAVYVSPGQLVLDWAWSWFELLEVGLQAFIFMLLTIVYLALAVQEEEH